MHNKGEVTAIVQNHVGTPVVGTKNGLFNAPPGFFLSFAFPRENWNARGSNGGRGLILRREDVARRPADFCAQRGEGLDQHGGLNGHVQAASDARALEGLLILVLSANGHQAGHLDFGQCDFLAAPLGQLDVLDFIIRLDSLGRSTHDSFLVKVNNPRDIGLLAFLVNSF